jgi:N-acetylglucosaminyldiphosphoundecaprenol N-acetyl-beta-D-mannosaminyltransferase
MIGLSDRGRADVSAAALEPFVGMGASCFWDRRMTALPRIELRGVKVHAVTQEQCIAHILGELEARRGGYVVTPNLDHLRRLQSDEEFRSLYEGASLVVADGMPLVWASRLQGTPLPQRVAGSSLIEPLALASAERGKSLFLLGGAAGAADGAAEALRRLHPAMRIAGNYGAAVGFDQDPRQMRRLIDALYKADPDIVLVALGSPKQERLIGQLRHHLPRAWWLGIGISFSFLAGQVARAPRWMQRSGLEWAHRLCQEPKRLARRYLIDGLPFAAGLLAGAAVGRFIGNAAEPQA